MKEIKAYIQPFMLQKVTDALHEIHIHGMSVGEIKGFGKEKDEGYPHHSRDHVTEFTPKMKIEIICLDDEVSKIVDTIRRSGHTGRKGDGKIVVTDVEKVFSIRNNDVDERAV